MTTAADDVRGNPTGHGTPDNADSYIVDQGHDRYTAEEHETWEILFERQYDIIRDRACQESLDGLEELSIDRTKIPDFRELNKILKNKTGWEVVAVPGLIPDLPFFKLLSERKFPAGNFIRTREQINYIQEPDIFHDVFGHVPLLANPIFAEYLEAFGKGGLRAHDMGAITNLARLYWFTVEFGLIDTPKGLRVYGAGILSSPGETVFCLEDPSPNRVRFDLKRIMQTEYRVDDYQQTYFVIDSFKQLFDETYSDFAGVYADMKAENKSYGLAELTPQDRLINIGTQEYATERGKLKKAG